MIAPIICCIISVLSLILPGTQAIFPFGYPGPAFIFQTSTSSPATNNSAGTFNSNISFDAISNVSNVVVAVSQTMGRSLEDADSAENTFTRHINSSVFLFKDGNWTSYKLRKRRNTGFDLAKQITNQVFAAVNGFMNQTANQTTFDLMEQLLNASSFNISRSSRAYDQQQRRHPRHPLDPFQGVNLFESDSQQLIDDLQTLATYSPLQRAILKAVSRNLMTDRSRGWRTLVAELKDMTRAAKSSMTILQGIFKNAMNEFLHAMTNSSQMCGPSEADRSSLNSLFRTSASSMSQCFGQVFLQASLLVEDIRGKLSTPLGLPLELSQQFNYCDTLNINNPAFGAINEPICWAKLPYLLETFAVNTRMSYDQVLGQGRHSMGLLKGNLMQCSLNEIDAIQGMAQDWYSTYNECVANSSGSTITTTTPNSS